MSRKANREFTNEEIKNIISLYLNGISQSEIARKYNVSCTTIGRKLKEAEVKKNNKVFSEEEKRQIIEVFNSNHNVFETANLFHVQREDIIPILREYNITPPTRSDARRKYKLNEEYFKIIDTQNKAYILGFFYADGNVGSNDYSVIINLNEDDKYILEKMNLEFSNSKPLDYRPVNLDHRRPNPQYRIQIYSKKMHSDLIDKGVIPNKSLLLEYPDFLPDDLHSHFIRGVLDGDGCITYSKNKYNNRLIVQIACTYKFGLGLKNICNRILNINSHVYVVSKNGITSDFCIFKKDDVKTFLDWIYRDAEMYLKRKYQRYADYYDISNISIA